MVIAAAQRRRPKSHVAANDSRRRAAADGQGANAAAEAYRRECLISVKRPFLVLVRIGWFLHMRP